MSSGFQAPRIIKTSQSTQITYELPHRVHTSVVYPTKAPNGSSVIIYGHENGVRVVWRGGRRFKPSQGNANAASKTNGSEKMVISLDSDDEEAPASKYDDQVEFEGNEDADFLQPFPGILQSLDLYLGVEVTHLAVLPAFATKANASLPKGFEVLAGKIVFTAACSDSYLRLITLPLTPPSHESKARAEFRKHPFNSVVGHGNWGETIIRLHGHQRPADGVSMTVNVANNLKDAKADTRSPTRSEPSIVIASHSRESTGLLLVFKVPLHTKIEQIDPYQTIHLPSPASCIAFNTSSSAPRSSHLLVAESTGVCRIYDYTLISRSSEESQIGTSLQGSWLLSLYPGFKNSKADNNINSYGAYSAYGRKAVIDAKWLSSGQAVIVLFDDGEWAIWDIEGVGPRSSQGLLGKEGIKGGSKTAYSISGYIESASKIRAGPQIAGSKFAPMTPSTRKLAEPFGSRQQSGSSRGQISVLESPSASPTVQAEETITFWFGETFAVISNLSKYWASQQNGMSNVFSGTSGGRFIKLEAIDLQGESCSGIDQLLHSSGPTTLPDILILGEHRFTIVSLARQTRQPQFHGSDRLAVMEKSSNGGGLQDIDRALALMDRGSKMELI